MAFLRAALLALGLPRMGHHFFTSLQSSVQVRALRLGPLALLAGGTTQCSRCNLHAPQAFDQSLGLRGGHLADGQGGELLDGGRLGAALGQPQQGIGGEAPLVAVAAPAASALEAEGSKAALDGGLVAVRNTAELVLAVGTKGGGVVGFLLRGLFEHLPEEFLAAAQELFFELAEVFVRRAERLMELPAQVSEQGFATGGQEVSQGAVLVADESGGTSMSIMAPSYGSSTPRKS